MKQLKHQDHSDNNSEEMDPAFRLFLGVLVSYLAMGIYRKLLRRMPLKWHHLYFLTTGLCTSYFVLGLGGPLHGLWASMSAWMVLRGLGVTKLSTAINFVLQIIHLSAINVATLNDENLVCICFFFGMVSTRIKI